MAIGTWFGLTLAGFAGLAVCHVVENILHGPAVGQRARSHLAVGLLAPLALVGVEQQNQLLLDQLALLRVSRGACGHTLTCYNSDRHLLLLGLRGERRNVGFTE